MIEPQSLIELIAELEGGVRIQTSENVFYCESRSVDDPTRLRLWIVPRSTIAGANPKIWLRDHLSLLDSLIRRNIALTSVVFTGAYPRGIERHNVEIHQTVGAAQDGPKRVFHREVRVLSAAAHLWIDRLNLHDDQGNIDFKRRNERLTALAGRYFTTQDEASYIQPNLDVVAADSPQSGERLATSLVSSRPLLPRSRLTVIFGPGGSGKSLLLRRIANRLARVSRDELTAPIPVLVQLTGILHGVALENWLARHGFEHLTLAQLTTLLHAGVIIPLLDALDEVVKGDARVGGDELLNHLFSLMECPSSSGILACRDYYLTMDKAVVRDRADQHKAPQFFIGPFTAQDTRRFIQLRAELSPEDARRWTDALEREARDLLDPSLGEEVIRHPVVLATLAQYITDLPVDDRVAAAAEFRLSEADVFGPIVDALLKRETEKHLPLWRDEFHDHLMGEWANPFDYRLQRRILEFLTLTAARTPYSPPEAVSAPRHALYTTSPEAPKGDTPTEVLAALLIRAFGPPQIVPGLSEEDESDIRSRAIAHLTESYRVHILATSDPEVPESMVFALRHRFYFDYFLAEALLNQLDSALASKQGETLVNWCVNHHVTDSFATCLDFLATSPKVLGPGRQRLLDFFADGGDEVLGGYLLSLALALFLRRRHASTERIVSHIDFSAEPALTLLLGTEFLPNRISDLKLDRCSLPGFIIDSLDFQDVDLSDCDFGSIEFGGYSKLTRCFFRRSECASLTFSGRTAFQDCTVDLECDAMTVRPNAKLELYNCRLGLRLMAMLQLYKETGFDVTLKNMSTIESVAGDEVSHRVDLGRKLVNQILRLMRKSGHNEFGAFIYKVRGRVFGTPECADAAIACLCSHGICAYQGVKLIMTPYGESIMYQPERRGEEGYDSHEDAWDPVIRALDEIFAEALD